MIQESVQFRLSFGMIQEYCIDLKAAALNCIKLFILCTVPVCFHWQETPRLTTHSKGPSPFEATSSSHSSKSSFRCRCLHCPVSLPTGVFDVKIDYRLRRSLRLFMVDPTLYCRRVSCSRFCPPPFLGPSNLREDTRSHS